jgi:hypothetical protein
MIISYSNDSNDNIQVETTYHSVPEDVDNNNTSNHETIEIDDKEEIALNDNDIEQVLQRVDDDELTSQVSSVLQPHHIELNTNKNDQDKYTTNKQNSPTIAKVQNGENSNKKANEQDSKNIRQGIPADYDKGFNINKDHYSRIPVNHATVGDFDLDELSETARVSLLAAFNDNNKNKQYCAKCDTYECMCSTIYTAQGTNISAYRVQKQSKNIIRQVNETNENYNNNNNYQHTLRRPVVRRIVNNNSLVHEINNGINQTYMRAKYSKQSNNYSHTNNDNNKNQAHTIQQNASRITEINSKQPTNHTNDNGKAYNTDNDNDNNTKNVPITPSLFSNLYNKQQPILYRTHLGSGVTYGITIDKLNNDNKQQPSGPQHKNENKKMKNEANKNSHANDSDRDSIGTDDKGNSISVSVDNNSDDSDFDKATSDLTKQVSNRRPRWVSMSRSL